MFESIKAWWYRRYKEPFTVACDVSPFHNPRTDREELFHVFGLAAARALGRKWVEAHPYGQARFIPGHKYWENPEADRLRCEKEHICADASFHSEGYW